MVSLEEIEKNDFNLNIPRYIDNTDKEDIQDIFGHLHGLIPKKDICDIEELKIFKNLENALFEELSEDYCRLKINIEELRDVIENSEEVKTFKDNILDIFDKWCTEKISFLTSIHKNI